MRATTLPCSARVSMRMLRTFTIANSPATKNALAASSRMISMMVNSMMAWPWRPTIPQTSSRSRSTAGRHLVAEQRVTDAARQDEAHAARSDLLIAGHRIEHRRRLEPARADLARIGREADRAQMGPNAGSVVRRAKTKPHRQLERLDQAQRHRLAVQQRAAVAGQGLVGVGEGVAEIEQGAPLGLALVGRHDRRLGAAAGDDRVPLRFPHRQPAAPGRGARARQRTRAGRSARTSPPRHSRSAARVAAAWPGRPCPPGPASADGTRRSGSCRGVR